MRFVRGITAAAALTVVTLVAALSGTASALQHREGPAPAAEAWTSPVTLSQRGVYSEDPDLVIDRFGTVTVAWIQESGELPGGLMIRRRPPGAGWGTATMIAPDAVGGVTLRTDRDGRATILYYRWAGGARVYAVSENTDGTLGQPVRLDPTGTQSRTPQLAVDPTGTATAAWIEHADGRYRVAVARGTLDGVWSAPTYLSSAATRVRGLTMDAGPDGVVTAVWSGQRTDIRHASWRVRTRTLFDGKHWSATRMLSRPSRRASLPQMASGTRGRVQVAWVEGSAPSEQVQSRWRRADGAWTRIRAISPRLGPHRHAYLTSVDVGPGGVSAVAWVRDDDSLFGAGRVFVRVRAHGVWDSTKMTSPATGSASARTSIVRVATSGAVRVVWMHQAVPSASGDNLTVQTRLRSAQGHWGPTVNLSRANASAFDSPSIAFGPGRSASVVWTGWFWQIYYSVTH